MLGQLVEVKEATHTGTRTVLGTVVKPLHLEGEEVVMVTVEGQVIETTIHGLPLPLTTEESVRLELVPVKSRYPELISMKALT